MTNMPTDPSAQLLAEAVRFALANGILDSQEKQAIKDLCQQLSIPPAVARQVFLMLKEEIVGTPQPPLAQPGKYRVETLEFQETDNPISLKHLVGITLDTHKNCYVTDSHNHWICKIDNAHQLQILAGSGNCGLTDGPGEQACFNHPSGVAIASSNSLFVVDSENHCIREVKQDGIVTLFVGNKSTDLRDGHGVDARFNSPGDVIFDRENNLIVSDTDNHAIRKITPHGNVTTIAGNGLPGYQDGMGKEALFKHPWGLTVDGENNIYVSDTGNHCIRKITPAGEIITVAGTCWRGHRDGQAKKAQFNRPFGLELDPWNNLLVADLFNNCIRKISPDGEVSTLAGNRLRGFQDGPSQEALFAWPMDLVSAPDGTIYVTDWANKAVRVLRTEKI